MAQIIIDGRSITLPDEIAQEESRLREALEPFYPEVRNATIQRSTNAAGELRVTLIKRAGPKGAEANHPPRLVEALAALPETIHPAMRLAWELQLLERRGALSISELLARHAEIEEALASAVADATLYRSSCTALRAAPPVAAPAIPLGF